VGDDDDENAVLTEQIELSYEGMKSSRVKFIQNWQTLKSISPLAAIKESKRSFHPLKD
jgi:hypothetical protein